MQSHTTLGHTNLLLDYMYGHCLSCSNDDHDCRAIACTGSHSVQDMTCTCMYLLISAICPCCTMAFITSLQLSGLGRHQVANIRPFSSSQQPVRRTCVKHACTCSASEAPRALDRRETLLSLAAVATALNVNQAEAEGETKTLFGKASPPTSYGGYGGNAKEGAKYTFEYPASWKNDVVNKTEKGMQGIDSRVINPKIGKTQGAFVVTFGRAGEDKKFNKLGDVEATLQGFAGADYDLQDALVGATDKKNSQHEKDGELFYDYEVTGADLHYLASITLKSGKVFALFVKSPTKNYAVDRDKLKAIVDSFTVL